ncbi:MAG: hypothetical protein ACMG6E_01525 [Candidatus Roizmanbacteria bacterium]
MSTSVYTLIATADDEFKSLVGKDVKTFKDDERGLRFYLLTKLHEVCNAYSTYNPACEPQHFLSGFSDHFSELIYLIRIEGGPSNEFITAATKAGFFTLPLGDCVNGLNSVFGGQGFSFYLFQGTPLSKTVQHGINHVPIFDADQFRSVQPATTRLVLMDFSKGPVSLEFLKAAIHNSYNIGTLDADEIYLDAMFAAMRCDQLEALACLCGGIYYHDRDHPAYEQLLEYAFKNCSRKVAEQCVWNFQNAATFDKMEPIKRSTILSWAHQNDDVQTRIYAAIMMPDELQVV